MKVRMSVEQDNTEHFIEGIMVKYHFPVSDKEALLQVYENVRRYMAPYAVYRINSRMRGIPLIDNNQCAIVAMTLGEGIDRLQQYYEQENALAESYMAECVANELLLLMYAEFNRSYPKFHRRFVQRYVFIGEEIPLTCMEDLVDEIYGRNRQEEKQSQDIRANEYGVLFPSKSVVYFAVLSDNPSQNCQGICVNCRNASCGNRMHDTRQLGERQKVADEKDETAATGIELHYGYQRIFSAR